MNLIKEVALLCAVVFWALFQPETFVNTCIFIILSCTTIVVMAGTFFLLDVGRDVLEKEKDNNEPN